MKRWTLFLEMCLLLTAMAVVIALRSPMMPTVQPVRDIEDIWAIEDARRESETPLVTALSNDGVPLGYDAQTNTFYCTLGLGQGDEWPQLNLNAPPKNRGGVELCFTDDYTYDSCAEAIREGYAYELLAYTDEAYNYFYIIFTGLPIVTIHADAPVDRTDVEAQVQIGRHGEAVKSSALVHRRGAGSAAVSDKKSYTVKFARSSDRRNVFVDMPIMGVTDQFILLSGVQDVSLLRDRLSWALYGSLVGEEESFGARRTEYAEVFENDEYMGVAILMNPMDAAQELRKSGGGQAALTDSVYRSTQLIYPGDRLYAENPVVSVSGYELFHQPGGGDPFAPLSDYMALEQETDDARFAALAAQAIDTDSLVRYYLFVQAGAMSDNVYNNMYIWAHRASDGVRYRFAPWDMDLTWGRYKDPETGEVYHDLFTFDIAQRMLELDVGGARQALCAQWQKMRSGAFTAETVEGYVRKFAAELTESGAFVRNSERWGLEVWDPDPDGIVSFAGEHFAYLDDCFAQWAQ